MTNPQDTKEHQAGYAVYTLGQDIANLEKLFAESPELVAIDYSDLWESYQELSNLIVRINKFMKGE